MHFTRTKLAATAAVSLLTARFIFAGAEAAPHARPQLLASQTAIVAGKPFVVAIDFELDPSWHVYWKDPGDSGMPPSVMWTLPPGFTAGELRFPAPKVLKTSAGVNYVYADRVALLATITPPAELKTGDTYNVKADVKWLECDVNVCLPGKQSLGTSVVAADQASPNEPEKFAQWEAAVKAGEGFDPKKSE